MREYKDVIEDYCVDGIVTLTNNPPALTDNCFLFTATDIFVKYKLYPGYDLLGERLIINNYYKLRVEASPTKKLPLPNPSWGHANLSHDEVNGAACASKHLAKELYKNSPLWMFNATGNFGDNFRGWYYRFGYLVAFLKVRADVKPNILDEIRYEKQLKRISELPWQEPDINTSSRCLVLLQSQHMNEFTPRMRKAMETFLARTEEQFGSLDGLYGVYFRGHAFAEYTKGVKFR